MVKIYESLLEPRLVSMIREGKIGVIPTDTQYGVICSAINPIAVKNLYNIKNRHRKPGTIIAANTKQLVNLGLKKRYIKPVEYFWPNPVSVIIPTGENLQYLHQGLQTLAVRIPKHEQLISLLNNTGPLLTSSANNPGEEPANTIQEAIEIFDDSIDFYVDGGRKYKQLPSTVIRIIDDEIEIIRYGAAIINNKGEVNDIK